MINRRISSFVLVLMLVFLTTAPVQAQQHRATRLGNPATRFATPLQTPQDLRAMLNSEKLRADVDFIAKESGYLGTPEDLRLAASNAVIVEIKIPPGTLLPAMSARKNGKPELLREVLWAGKEPIDAYEFFFSSKGRRYRVVTPKACANFWVEDFGKEGRPVLTIACTAPAEVPLRRRVEVCLTVSNTGNAGESSTTVTLPMPVGTVLANATADGKGESGKVTWELANLSAGRTTNVCAEFITAQPGTLEFVATARGNLAEAASSRCETRVVGIPAILLEVVDLDDPIEVGKNQTYEIRVTNQGTGPVTNVRVVCLLEDSQEFVSGTGTSEVTAQDHTVNLSALPTLNPKDKATWRVVVKTLKAGDVRFTTELRSDQFQEPIKEIESTRQY
jgi:uncharacterized repeat protein (TIGR01451 family)